ncbi:MAG TPA: helix-turn-helix domain-containing protein [Anaeromyxobacteraceae bacterium]|nr:helix-turn-helix domain-containing protein [Anaeromyxobacteraceae bacterium]
MAPEQSSFEWVPSAGRDPEAAARNQGRAPRRASASGASGPIPANSPWLTAQQAARYLGLPSVQALYKRIERASVPREAVRRWGRQFRFKRELLDALMGRHG